MQTQLECLPSFVRQALEAARHARADEAVQKSVLRQVCQWTSDADLSLPPPAMGQQIHRLVRELTGNRDPYAKHKITLNEAALALLPELREAIEQSPDPWLAALRVAIAGNAMDLGVYGQMDPAAIRDNLFGAMDREIAGQVHQLRQALAKAEHILYIADNTGEIVVDRLWIEKLDPTRITVAVRGRPIINDATMQDAQAAGLTDIAEVIDNGSDAPGTLLAECSEQFKRHFTTAEVVLAKGQGNFETLSSIRRPNLFFLLMAKCPLIVSKLNCRLRELVVACADELIEGV